MALTNRWTFWFGIAWLIIFVPLIAMGIGVGSLIDLPMVAVLIPFYVCDTAMRRGDRRIGVRAVFWLCTVILAVFDILLVMDFFRIHL